MYSKEEIQTALELYNQCGSVTTRGAGMAEYLANELNYREQTFNEGIFNSFYDEYYEKVYNYIYFKTGAQDDVEDLTCGVMEKVLNNLHRYNPAAGSLNTWALTVARNHLIDYFRLKRRNESYFEEGEERQIADRVTPKPEDELMHAERQELISGLLQRLPETEQEVMILKFWSGLKNIEIGAQLGISGGNINVMVFRTLKKLKKIIEENNIEL